MPVRAGILLLEGVARFRASLIESLGDLGFPVIVAPDAVGALRLLRTQDIALAIADASLADPGTRDFVTRMRVAAGDPGLGVFLTALADPSAEDVVLAVEGGILGILQRNAPLAETIYRVNAHLSGHTPARFTGAPRVQVRTPVQFSRLGEVGARARAGVAEDLSRTGILLTTAADAPIGAQLRLRFQLPIALRPIDCEGLVARVTEGPLGVSGRRLGVAFRGLRASDRHGLARFVIDRLRSAPPITRS